MLKTEQYLDDQIKAHPEIFEILPKELFLRFIQKAYLEGFDKGFAECYRQVYEEEKPIEDFHLFEAEEERREKKIQMSVNEMIELQRS